MTTGRPAATCPGVRLRPAYGKPREGAKDIVDARPLAAGVALAGFSAAHLIDEFV